MNFQLIPCFLDAFVFSCVLMFHCCLVVFVCFSYGNFFCMRLCVSFVLLAPLFSGTVCICIFSDGFCAFWMCPCFHLFC